MSARVAWVALLLAAVRVAAAQEMTDDEVEHRLRFLEARLHGEARQAQLYEAGWSFVYVGGMGYGTYQIAHQDSNAALAEGVVGVVKPIFGAISLALFPLKTARTLTELDQGTAPAAGGIDARLALAESLLRRNAEEADLRYKWQPHVFGILLNLIGGVIVGIAGDWLRALQSTGISVAFGELNVWTIPWKAKKDLRDYRREFGGLATGRRTATVESGPSLRAGAGGLALTF